MNATTAQVPETRLSVLQLFAAILYYLIKLAGFIVLIAVVCGLFVTFGGLVLGWFWAILISPLTWEVAVGIVIGGIVLGFLKS